MFDRSSQGCRFSWMFSSIPTPASSSATCPLFSPKCTRRTVCLHHRLCEHCYTSHCSAGCFSGCHTLPEPLFLGFGSLHHGNHLGSSHSIPRWSLRLCPHGATLKTAAWLTCFASFNCLFWLAAQSQGFFLRGMGLARPGDQAAVSHPAQCETHALLISAMVPHGFQSHSEIGTGQSQMV